LTFNRSIAPLAVTAVCALAAADAWRGRWVGDDAFISFRYAKNWVGGLGLVYNAGEQVEGYTNFLWTVLIGLFLELGLDPVGVSAALGVLCFAGTLGVLVAASHWMRSEIEGAATQAFVPIAAVGWAACFHARIYATSGLETSLFTLLACLTIVGAGASRLPLHWALTGSAGVLAALTRPDGALLLGLAGLAALYQAARERKLGGVLAVSAPGLVLLVYAAWKLSFYGDLRPNTYYAKSAYLSWWDQGLLYLGYFFRSYWVLALGWPLAALAATRGPTAGLQRTGALLAAAPALYLLYVARVGGGFMFGRFCIPVAPLLLLGIEAGLLALPPLRARVLLVGAAVWLGMLFAPMPDLERGAQLGISDEWRQYPPELVARSRTAGRAMKELLEGTEPTVVIYGYQAMLAYYGEFPAVIEGVTGLTDAAIAHMVISERGRPGHEKKASPAYLQGRGVDFLFEFPIPLGPGGYTEIDFGPLKGRLVTYDRSLMASLKQRGARFTDFEVLLDEYLAGVQGVPKEALAADYATFRAYYFEHNVDPEREARFEAALATERAPAAPSPPPDP